MRKKISFIVLDNIGSPVKNITVSKALFRFISVCFVAVLILAAFVLYNYYSLTKQDLELNIAKQSEEIISQRQQIQKFAAEVNNLKSNLVELNNFEKKIRVIANIEKPSDKESLFGVGGSIPEDLDSQVPLTKKYNSLMREMHAQTQQIDLATINQQKGFESLLKYLEDQRNLLSSTPAISPTKGWITSGFGYRISPFTGLREFHKALDIATRLGTPVIATADGTVTFAGNQGYSGKVIVINHGHGITTNYGHLKEILKKRGDKVKRGDTIALVGVTGRSTGPHVHYSVLLNGVPVNPKKYILN